MWSRPAYQNLSKALDMSRATTRVAPDLLKALAILSDTTVGRSGVDQEDLKPFWKSFWIRVYLEDFEKFGQSE